MQVQFIPLIAIVANLVAIAVAGGALLLIAWQPDRDRTSGLFALFLAALIVWCVASMMPGNAEVISLPPEARFNLLMSGVGVAAVAFFAFSIDFCAVQAPWARRVLLSSPLMGAVLLILLWTGNLFTSVNEPGLYVWEYRILPLGLAAVIYALALYALAFFFAHAIADRRARPVERAALLMLLGQITNAVPALAALNLDAFAATGAVVMVGEAVLRARFLTPLTDARHQLRVANQDLRQAIIELSAERERSAKLKDELSQLSRAKSEFMARMSHELRTPLNSIVGYSELVLDGVYGELTDRQRDRLERILRNGRNLLGLVNDVLDLSRIDAGHLELTFSNVRVTEAVRLAVASMEPLAQAKGLPILVNIEGDPPNIRADELRLRQVICNLLDNAIKFTERGRISVWAGRVRIRDLEDSRFPQLGHGDWLVVRVTDTGIGIDPALHQTIFEDFVQADGSYTRHYEGGGLGLAAGHLPMAPRHAGQAISRRLVMLHGGVIWVDSLPGEGATFSFGIPYTGPAARAEAAPEAEPEIARAQPLILAVDDEAEALDILDACLSPAGYRVVRAQGGESALEMAAQLRPDVIALDILMPDLDGWQVLERLRAHPRTADIPVVIASIVDQRPRAGQLGAVGYVCKPIDRAALLSAVADAVKARPRLPILVVDEKPHDRGIFSAVLRMAGHRVVTAEDEEEAITWLQDRRAGLVLLDLERDSIGDLKVLDFMRQHAPAAETPALVIWTDDVPEETRTGLRARRAWVLKKRGLAQETLIETVARALENQA